MKRFKIASGGEGSEGAKDKRGNKGGGRWGNTNQAGGQRKDWRARADDRTSSSEGREAHSPAVERCGILRVSAVLAGLLEGPEGRT